MLCAVFSTGVLCLLPRKCGFASFCLEIFSRSLMEWSFCLCRVYMHEWTKVRVLIVQLFWGFGVFYTSRRNAGPFTLMIFFQMMSSSGSSLNQWFPKWSLLLRTWHFRNGCCTNSPHGIAAFTSHDTGMHTWNRAHGEALITLTWIWGRQTISQAAGDQSKPTPNVPACHFYIRAPRCSK